MVSDIEVLWYDNNDSSNLHKVLASFWYKKIERVPPLLSQEWLESLKQDLVN